MTNFSGQAPERERPDPTKPSVLEAKALSNLPLNPLFYLSLQRFNQSKGSFCVLAPKQALAKKIKRSWSINSMRSSVTSRSESGELGEGETRNTLLCNPTS